MKKILKPVTVLMMTAMLSASVLTACGSSKTDATTAAATEAAKETTAAAKETTEAAKETTEAAKETTEAAKETTAAADKAETVAAESLVEAGSAEETTAAN